MPRSAVKDVDERLSKLEDKVKRGFFEMEKRLASIEAAKSESIGERIKEVEDLQMLSQLEIMKLKETQTMPVQSALPSPDIERKINDLLHRVDAMESQKLTEKSAEYFISKIVREKRDLENEFDRLRSLKKDFAAIMKEKEEISKRIADSELNLEKVDALYSKMKTMDEKVSAEVDKIYSMMKGIEERVNESMEKVSSIRKTVESRIQLAEEKFRVRSDKLESLRDSLNAKLALVDDKLRELESFRKLVGDVNTFRASMEEESIQRIALEKSVQDLDNRIDDIEDNLNFSDINRKLEDEYVTVVSLEKKLQDFSRRSDALNAKIEAISSSANVAVDSKIKYSDYPKTINDLKEKLLSIEASQKELKEKFETQALAPENILDDAKQKFESAVEEKIAYFSSRVDELGMKMQLEKEQISKSLNMDELMKIRNDILAQKRGVHDIERSLEISAVRFFTENLEEFAKELDKKLPQVVTRDEFSKEMKLLDTKLKKIHAPDISGIGQRLLLVERKIGEIYALTRNFSMQQPIIVE